DGVGGGDLAPVAGRAWFRDRRTVLAPVTGTMHFGATDSLVTCHSVHSSSAATLEQRLRAYRALIDDDIAPELLTLVRDTTNACRVLGNERFKDQIESTLGRSVRPGKPGPPAKNSA
ncbi:MAG: hypothetical protein OEX13_09585, partial [Gammaproteobacteria bacterium]|nr:hypothetical protein [Gammaproteobacteria bacterium]